MSKARRIDGWKGIAGHFNRDRSTVMRWARERGLPVHRLPGGKQGTVFALEDELTAWARAHPEDAAADPGPLPAAHPPRRRPRRLVLVACLLVGALALALGWWGWSSRRPASPALPHDPRTAALYVEARDSWGRRTGPDVAHAIETYRAVIRRDPGFAPAHAGLADAWLAAREYGGIEDSAAFGAAREAAERAIRLDPRLPAAHRALGFIHYWWSDDAVEAIRAFERALELGGDDAQTHFWYANILAYIGRHADADVHYARARLLSPGTQAIEVEYGCAQWLAGRDRQALDVLGALVRRYPDDPTARQCLAWVYLGQDDVRGYAREYAELARIRRAPALLRNSADVNAALAKSEDAARAAILAYLRRELGDGTRRLHETAAFFASSLGDRATLVEWLRIAVDRQERWEGASITRRIAERWPRDAEVQRLLALVRVPVPAKPR